MSLTKKILGVSMVLATCFASNPARANNWVYIGSTKGFNYYVDTNKEVVRGSFWAAPIKAIESNNTYLGKAAINCRNYTVKIKFGNNINDWRRINRDSPMDFVGRKVCS